MELLDFLFSSSNRTPKPKPTNNQNPNGQRTPPPSGPTHAPQPQPARVDDQQRSNNATPPEATTQQGTTTTSTTSSVPQTPRSIRMRSAVEREKSMVLEISKPRLDIKQIRKLAFEGLPEGELRALYWRLLLGYLPLDRSQWESELASKRKLYREFLAELRSNPQCKEEMSEQLVAEEAADHPLSQSASSTWNEFFKENDIINQIEKDVHRTFPHLHFFQIEESEVDEDAVAIPLQNHHYRALRSILFLYAKLNSGISYVQGMNEILGPIYYVFAIDPNEDFSKHAEADAFFCFTSLMGEIKDSFVKNLDHSKVGIRQKIRDMNDILRLKDYELWENLEHKQLSPEFYSFRWLTLLLSQEFELPDVLRLWDSLFSDPNRFQYLLYVCIAMLINIREQLLAGDFAESLKILQTYPPTDITRIMDLANDVADPEFAHVVTSESNGIVSKAQHKIFEFLG